MLQHTLQGGGSTEYGTTLVRQEARRLAERVSVLAGRRGVLLDDLDLGARDARDDGDVPILARAQDDEVAGVRAARLLDACKRERGLPRSQKKVVHL